MIKTLLQRTSASVLLALMLLAPVANAAENQPDKQGSGESKDSSAAASSQAGNSSKNTIIIGGPAGSGSMSANTAAGSSPVSVNVVQEQTITSPYNR